MPQMAGDLLLDVGRDPAAGRVTTNRGDVGRLPGQLGQLDRVVVIAETRSGEPPRDREFAGLPPELVTALDFKH